MIFWVQNFFVFLFFKLFVSFCFLALLGEVAATERKWVTSWLHLGVFYGLRRFAFYFSPACNARRLFQTALKLYYLVIEVCCVISLSDAGAAPHVYSDKYQHQRPRAQRNSYCLSWTLRAIFPKEQDERLMTFTETAVSKIYEPII